MRVAGLERKTNPQLVETIRQLRQIATKEGSGLWRTVAQRLIDPSKTWSQVNVEKIQQVAGDSVAVVCGKVLSTGSLTGPVRVAAIRFSANAIKKIKDANGEVLDLVELAQKNPTGTGVKLVA